MTTEDLSEDARTLLDAGKTVSMPEATRTRMRGALFAQLAIGGGAAVVASKAAVSLGAASAAGGAAGATGATGSAAGVAATVTGWSLAVKAVVVATALGVAGGGVYIATRDTQPASVTHSQSVHVATPPTVRAPNVGSERPTLAPLGIEPSNMETQPVNPAADIPQVPVRARRAAQVAPQTTTEPEPTIALADRVDEEARLIRNAVARNREGRYEDALRFLRTHAMLHPTGTLVDERTATQIEALCGLQRTAEATTLRTAFLGAHPDSPLRARMMAACNAP